MSSLGPRGLLRSPQRNKRGAGGSSFRDLDLHPDFVPSPAAVGPMARAKRQLQSAGLEDPSAKLRRLKTTAEAKAAEAAKWLTLEQLAAFFAVGPKDRFLAPC